MPATSKPTTRKSLLSHEASGRIVANEKEGAQFLVKKVGAALGKPGISRGAVFRGANPEKVFAYSVVPDDPTRVIRQTMDGTRVEGRLGKDGRFRAFAKRG